MHTKRVIAIILLLILCWYISFLFQKRNSFFQKITIQDQIPTITITKDNQFDIITQTGDELLYRNEIYGFELHLWPETKGLKIKEIQEEQARGTMINFYAKLPDIWSWEIMKSETPLSQKFPNWQDVFAVHIVPSTEYNERCNTEQFGWTMKDQVEKDTLGHQDWLYFVQNNHTNTSHDDLSQIIPYLDCKAESEINGYRDISCWNWLDRIIKQRFSFIKRSFKKYKNDHFS
jgi:hypothetical protein